MENVSVRPISSAEFWSAPNIGELLAEYAAECSIAGLPAPRPERKIYEVLEASGLLHVFGAFIGDELIGFLVMVVSVNPHYGVKLGVTESIFVASEYRSSGAGLKLLRSAENDATLEGAVGFLVCAPLGSSFAQLLELYRPYAETNRVFFRGLS